jgi:hypothetical protein
MTDESKNQLAAILRYVAEKLEQIAANDETSEASRAELFELARKESCQHTVQLVLFEDGESKQMLHVRLWLEEGNTLQILNGVWKMED